jgi:phenylalanyl-tRNA synthetase beta chain
VLLEGASWNFINVRRTMTAQRMSSEAAYRFSRGVHPALARRGVLRGLELMRQWTDGIVGRGLVDAYPLPPTDPVVEITPHDARRWLGIDLTPAEMAAILSKLAFDVEIQGDTVQARTPDHRLDIGQGVVGMADLMEEIARVYGYDHIPETRMADTLPPQRGNPRLDREEKLRDILVGLGLQEVITYRLTSPENESRRLSPEAPRDDKPYVRLVNPISSERVTLRHSLLHSVLEVMERNARVRERIGLFEIGPIFLSSEEGPLPEEPSRLVVALTGPRQSLDWRGSDSEPMDFYDLKGIVTTLLESLHLDGVRFQGGEHPSFHPGRCGTVHLGDRQIGVMGELHPLVQEQYEIADYPVLAADLDADALIESIPMRYTVEEVPAYPPVLEDLAVVVDQHVPAQKVVEVIQEAGGDTVTRVRLFDLYQGEQIGPGKKSLAYSLTYQAPDRTLTDQEVAVIRERIIHKLGRELNARLRS